MTQDALDNENTQNEQELDTSETTTDGIQNDDTASEENTPESESSENVLDESSEENENSLSEPQKTKGIDKRIEKLLADKEEAKIESWRLQRQVELLSQQLNNLSTQTQQNSQQAVQQAVDPRLDPNSDKFDFMFYNEMLIDQRVKKEMATQRQQAAFEESAKLVKNQLDSYEMKIARARAKDNSFDQNMQKLEKIMTVDMKYGLSSMDNPAAFLNHACKNEKDFRTLLSLPSHHPSVQLKTMTELGLKFELSSHSSAKNNSSAVKPKPIPQVGKGAAFNSNGKYNEKTQKWSKEFIDGLGF